MKTGRNIIIILGVCSAILLSVRLFKRSATLPVIERKETVAVIDWSTVDPEVLAAVNQAGDKAAAFAKAEVADWLASLKQRNESDFLPWLFGYWQQQSLMLQACAWHIAATRPVQALTGETDTAAERLEAYFGDAFAARVIHPQAAQHRVDGIRREMVALFLNELNKELEVRQIEYRIRPTAWNLAAQEIAASTAAIEANRSVPLVIKGTTLGSAGIAIRVTQAVSRRISAWLLRRSGQELLEYGGRTALRHGGMKVAPYLILGFAAWEVADHQKTVADNLPVVRHIVNDGIDRLADDVLNDPRTGLLYTLEQVKLTATRQAVKAAP